MFLINKKSKNLSEKQDESDEEQSPILKLTRLLLCSVKWKKNKICIQYSASASPCQFSKPSNCPYSNSNQISTNIKSGKKEMRMYPLNNCPQGCPYSDSNHVSTYIQSGKKEMRMYPLSNCPQVYRHVSPRSPQTIRPQIQVMSPPTLNEKKNANVSTKQLHTSKSPCQSSKPTNYAY